MSDGRAHPWPPGVLGAASFYAAALVLLLSVTPALAQTVGPPPLPVVYQGAVYLDGEALSRDAELTVRVGDWESGPVPVRDGAYINLVVGPPSPDYIGEEVTFHLGGLRAEQRFAFPSLGQPRFETLRLDFTAIEGETSLPLAGPEPPEEDTSGFPWLAVVGGALGGLALLLIVLPAALRRRGTRPRRTSRADRRRSR